MKHLLNNMSEEEKNSIREQHRDKFKVVTENFSKLMNSKLGDSKPLVSEQSSPTEYQEIADYLYKSMKGLSSKEDSDNVKSIIFNRIKNKNDWEGVKKAFGVKDGENLEQWLGGEMRINLNDIMKSINQNDSQSKKEDSKYNPGSKIPLITNRQFIVGRAYQYSDLMRGKEELELDMKDVTVVRREKDFIIVKVSSLTYYTVPERKRGENPKQEYAYGVCVKIEFKDIIEWTGEEALQIRWFSDWVKSRIVPCQ